MSAPADIDGIKARLARIRAILDAEGQPVARAQESLPAYIAELIGHLRWLVDHDHLLKDLSAVLHEVTQLRAAAARAAKLMPIGRDKLRCECGLVADREDPRWHTHTCKGAR